MMDNDAMFKSFDNIAFNKKLKKLLDEEKRKHIHLILKHKQQHLCLVDVVIRLIQLQYQK